MSDGLLRLKDALPSSGIPGRSMEDSLLVATWNIREFDSSKGGARGIEPLLYIAEVLNAFDLIAVQEVRRELKPLYQLLDLMGSWWRPVVTDVTRGTSGNLERLAFLYDSRKVSFAGLVGEVVLPDTTRGDEAAFRQQFARTPFLVAFRAGWFKFTVCTAHLYYGTDRSDDPRRLAEIRNLAEFLADQRSEVHEWSQNVLMLGDFNVFSTSDATLRAVEESGFTVPDQLKVLPSNLPRTKHYDQIAFRTPEIADQLQGARAGVFDWSEVVYRLSEAAEYEADRLASARPGSTAMAYPTWRTYQMSDHLPMWVELKTDFSRAYLSGFRGRDPERALMLSESQEDTRLAIAATA